MPIFLFPFVIGKNFRTLLIVVATEIGWMTPSELRRGTEELRDAWNLLRNQILGRSVKPRTDLPESVTALVSEYFGDFRRWYDAISKAFLSEMFGLYNSEFQKHLKRYQEARQISLQALRKLPTGETLKAPDLSEHKDTGGLSPWVFALVAAGFAFYFWQRSKQ